MTCTARCRKSRKPVSTCRCSCGGSNHGSSSEARNGSSGPIAPAPSDAATAATGTTEEANGPAPAAPRQATLPAPVASLDPEEAAAATPELVRRLAAVFEAGGRRFHLVGGYVRDLMRGEDPKDVDATTTPDHPR